MDIQFISDYVCPYCLVAKQALKVALAQTGLEAEITWLPFELTPEPKERVDTYHDEARRAHYQILKEPCVQLGLDMKLPPNVIPRPYLKVGTMPVPRAAETHTMIWSMRPTLFMNRTSAG